MGFFKKSTGQRLATSSEGSQDQGQGHNSPTSHAQADFQSQVHHPQTSHKGPQVKNTSHPHTTYIPHGAHTSSAPSAVASSGPTTPKPGIYLQARIKYDSDLLAHYYTLLPPRPEISGPLPQVVDTYFPRDYSLGDVLRFISLHKRFNSHFDTVAQYQQNRLGKPRKRLFAGKQSSYSKIPPGVAAAHEIDLRDLNKIISSYECNGNFRDVPIESVDQAINTWKTRTRVVLGVEDWGWLKYKNGSFGLRFQGVAVAKIERLLGVPLSEAGHIYERQPNGANGC